MQNRYVFVASGVRSERPGKRNRKIRYYLLKPFDIRLLFIGRVIYSILLLPSYDY